MASERMTPVEARHPAAASAALIGKSVVVKGELEGSEDLTIEGQVEGKIELRDHTLTIGQGGRIKAQVFAKAVVVCGELVGNINASETVEIRESGSVDGDIVSPRVADCRRRALPGQHRHAEEGCGAGQGSPAPEPPAPWKIPPSYGA